MATSAIAPLSPSSQLLALPSPSSQLLARLSSDNASPSSQLLALPSPSSQLLAPPSPSSQLLAEAARALRVAGAAGDPRERYAGAHLAALRGAAALLAARARPALRRGPRQVWDLLVRVAPELAEWAAFYAAGAAKRAAAEAGQRGAVSAREADDLVRDTEVFLALVGAVVQG